MVCLSPLAPFGPKLETRNGSGAAALDHGIRRVRSVWRERWRECGLRRQLLTAMKKKHRAPLFSERTTGPRSTRILGRRVLKADVDGQSAELVITLFCPRKSASAVECELRFEGLATSSRMIEGVDSFDAVQNALVVIAADLFSLDVHQGLALHWKEPGETGFPTFPALRLLELPPLLPAQPMSVDEHQENGDPSTSTRYTLNELLSECAPGDMSPKFADNIRSLF